MEYLISWLENNKEWVFSGVGLSVLGFMGYLAKDLLSRDKGVSREISISPNPSTTQSPTVSTSPAITQAPIVNITNTVAPDAAFRPVANLARPISQAPLFALAPLSVTRDLMAVTGSSGDDAVESCIARFKMHDGTTGWIPDRFEVSIHYVERLSASGLPYEHDTGYLNQARWLMQGNDIHELLLIVRRNSLLYAVSGEEDQDFPLGEGSLVPLDVIGDKPYATVTFTDTTDGQRWQVEYAIGLNITGALTVRETTGLRRS